MVNAPCAGMAFALVLAWPAVAGGQVVENDAAPGDDVSVRLHVNEPGHIRLELYDPGAPLNRDSPAIVCFDRCRVRAMPGRYLLRLSGPPGSGVQASRRYLDLEENSDVAIDPPSSFGRYFGLGLGIAGPALILGGLFATVAANPYGEPSQPYYALGLGTFAAGVVATPTGWLMFHANGRPAVDVRPTLK